MADQGSPPSCSRAAGSKTTMYYVYLLKSGSGKFYVGYSSNLKQRMKDHIRGKVYTSRRIKTLNLVYYEAYNYKKSARDREKKLKQFGSSYHGLIKRLKSNS